MNNDGNKYKLNTYNYDSISIFCPDIHPDQIDNFTGILRVK